ncbi:acylneuraminate cytidylyltransferase family protein [Candidatus Pelagibacter sp.]|nr:acylneuraminate cytidylyltransferase family protein [Candidatus Pelagibacter sp.]
MNNRVVALIPARKNSVRIKNKNLKKIHKQPLLWWTLEAAKKSKHIDEIYVSSDSIKILSFSKKQNVKIIKRPKKFSNALALKKDVINHALNFLRERNKVFDYLIYLQPTSPLRNSFHIDSALKKIFKKKMPGLISVKKEVDESLWSVKIKNNKIINNISKNINFRKRSQDLEKIYKPNGAIFIFNLKKLKYKNQFDTSKGFGIFEMDKISSIDIDDKLDFKLANLILSYKK